MNVFIRVDASFEIGTGHVMRCLTLAHRLEKEGNTIAFICRSAEGDCIDLIEQQGFHVFKLPINEGSLWTYVSEQWEIDAKETIDIIRKNSVEKLIIDHYSIDIKWELMVQPFTKKIMVIDDLANREHDCDILLDQNFYINMDNRYKGLVPSSTRMLLGPRYALLREEFIEAKKNLKTFNSKIERLFIFFGGSDPTNETEKILYSIMPLIEKYNFEVDVVVGNSNQNKKRIKDISFTHKNINFYCQINNIAEIMAKADLAIGAGGATTWERVFLGLPSIVIAVAKNQVEVAKAVANKGAIIYLGVSNEVNGKQVLNNLELLYRDSDELSRIRKSCINLIS
ncbi:UDP-2,4-diacetamido-2,4,6-trideoxy-beta-L-altropyranose hydrolase [Lysinibacillus sp. NPDC097231]|uniref:UDP-2,4-diacetamido-2,4, 6-trideoxy-beta-L-altropyranose hydrolase n=1 Tax=Lysinibacillus sp. NPDC097231 TaxID=3364142 RepID=UPI0038163355